jgi:hypothetical protein
MSRTKPPDKEWKIVLARSGGVCAFPGCSKELLREVLVLTKMNWNSANMFGLMPITLRFSRLVGDILREVPDNETPKAKCKFYM